MGRSPCCSKEGLNRGAWTAMEDRILTDYIKTHGEGQWRDLPKRAGLKRCGKSCRLRWLNYLRPDIKRGNISLDEEELIIRLHKLLGNRWSLIAGRLPGRTDNEIKNYWNTNIGKRLQLQQQQQGQLNNLKPSIINQSKRKANANGNQTPSSRQQPSKASSNSNIPSRVVRTKATRCTKVFINIPELLPHLQHSNPSTMPQLLIEGTKPPSPEHNIAPKDKEDIDPSNFMIDNLELDENFLSEFLTTDFSQLQQPSDLIDHRGFGNKGDSYSNSDTTCTDQAQYSSTNSDDQSLFFTNDMMQHDTDFTSMGMAALMDSDFDWFQDQDQDQAGTTN